LVRRRRHAQHCRFDRRQGCDRDNPDRIRHQ
jgi:hypothetical protein